MNHNLVIGGRRRSGVILLVVLASLTFFSILVASYLVFSSDARRASFALSQRNIRAPDVDWIMNEALMTLIRGTSDGTNPFFGEDLLSDYYGHEGITLTVHNVDIISNPILGPQDLGTGFVRFPVDGANRPDSRPATPYLIDDLYSGRLITFTEGPLSNETFRVIRSIYRPTGIVTEYDDLFIDFPKPLAEYGVSSLNELFYDDPTVASAGFTIHLNGSPRNSPGVGFQAGNLNASTSGVPTLTQGQDPSQPFNAGTNPAVGFDLPLALQPNHLGTGVDKSTTPGDFDEGHDAPDHNNWFLSHRASLGDLDGNGTIDADEIEIIPSFHRPAVLNHILNEVDWSSATDNDYRNVMASLARATFRPLPIATNQLNTGISGLNTRFTGGSDEFALRTALLLRDDAGLSTTAAQSRARLDQLARALIEGKPDVDNDADGVADSFWIDLGLPIFSSPEGKLIRPLVAPMIEDLSGRLNINAHGNSELSIATPGMTSQTADWAGTSAALGELANQRFMFRGLGWGPAEIVIPTTSSSGLVSNVNSQLVIRTLRNERYRFGDQPLTFPDFPGSVDRDVYDAIRFGSRPLSHAMTVGVGYSTDPFGRGGPAIGRSGHIVAGVSGSLISTTAPFVNEAQNNPYEYDPTAHVAGDLPFTAAEFESILRINEFDSDMLSQTLGDRLRQIFVESNADGDVYAQELARSLTFLSRSDDSPVSVRPHASVLLSLVDLIRDASGGLLPINPSVVPNTQDIWDELIPPEIRLGRKVDVNRPFGNGFDDNANAIKDEPFEVTRRDNAADANDDDGDGTVNNLGETNETFAFGAFVGAVPPDYASVTPNYTFDEPAEATANDIPISGRQLLARHLYVLMMALTRDLEMPNTTNALFPSLDGNLVASTTDHEFYKARRIAQWAVNVVDYRDPDAIVTRFVFDPFPFSADGWTNFSDTTLLPVVPLSDAALLTGPPYPPHTAPPPKCVVWGVEEPQLVFSESLAFHDVRLRDIARDNGDGTVKGPTIPPDDDDSDQVRLPQGSAFLELFCPRPENNGVNTVGGITYIDEQTKSGVPQELYDFDATTGQWELNLAKTAPLGAPVWRIAVSERHDAAPGGDPTLDPQQLDPTAYAIDAASFQPEFPVEIDSTGGTLNYDRFILFRDFANTDTMPDAAFTLVQNMIANAGGAGIPIADMSATQVFYAPSLNGDAVTNADRFLQPGQYLTLAPRFTTHLGSKIFGGVVPGVPSNQRIVLDNTQGLIQVDHVNGRTTPFLDPDVSSPTASLHYTRALPMLIAAPRPTGWPTSIFESDVVGFNVSEPLPRGTYYPQPAYQYNGTPADLDGVNGDDYPLFDAYIDFSDVATLARDQPLDISPTYAGRIPPDPLGTEPLLGTIPRYCSAFLQRLADPTIAYHPVTNPYRTVDWIPIDLTVFTGEERDTTISGAATYTQRSRQRTGAVQVYGGGAIDGANALHSYATNTDAYDDVYPVPAPEGLALDTASDDFFLFLDAAPTTPPRQHVMNSLSFLNTVEVPFDATDQTANPAAGLGETFAGFSASAGSLLIPSFNSLPGNERNYPSVPYALHPWLNRPFATPYELLLVPACSQGRLFEEFSFISAMDPDVYPTLGPTLTDNPTTAPVATAPFRHLLNFFFSSDSSNVTPEISKLFDFVHTLPPFSGEVEIVNPQRLTSGTAAQVTLKQPLRELLSPPFSYRHENLRVGTLNLNTIGEFPVWAGLMQQHMTAAEYTSVTGAIGSADQLSYNSFRLSRRGYPVLAPGSPPSRVDGAAPYNYDPSRFDPDYPTEFAGVFKRATDANYEIDITGAGIENLRRRPVYGTLLRGLGALSSLEPATGTAPASADTPQFARASSQIPNPVTFPLHDRRRNPFMKYQTLMRMPNLVSDNSQVFAIRLTIGFFEVDANTLSLKEEYNADIGKNQRHQALFVVDRSIPVGFIPGEDLNSRNVVVFESYAQ